ncbi:MAG: HIT family hydrolase [Anaerolinea sp.]|nr:HIT family hydrolase [Anaerolinea sp.]
MEHLWSPWRMEYIMRNEPTSGCIFCQALQQQDSPANLIVSRGKTAFVILNRYPYTSGHIMVASYAHRPSLDLLDAETRGEMMELVSRGLQVLRAVYKPEGFNVGVNIGAAAGAGVADHVHIHVVPRWAGDTNFMSTLAGARVLPEALEDTYRRLCEAWEAV